MIWLWLAACGAGPAPDLTGVPLDGAPCTEDVTPLAPREVRVRLRRGHGVDDAEVLRLARAMAAYWAPHGVTLAVDGPIRPIPIEAALGAGDVDGVLAPLRALSPHAAPDAVLVVVVARVAGPATPAEHALGELSGLTVPPAGELHDRVGASGPIVVLAAGQRARPGTPLLGPAHELGHALGLPHAAGRDDLMALHPPGCIPALTPTEIALLGG